MLIVFALVNCCTWNCVTDRAFRTLLMQPWPWRSSFIRFDQPFDRVTKPKAQIIPASTPRNALGQGSGKEKPPLSLWQEAKRSSSLTTAAASLSKPVAIVIHPTCVCVHHPFPLTLFTAPHASSSSSRDASSSLLDWILCHTDTHQSTMSTKSLFINQYSRFTGIDNSHGQLNKQSRKEEKTFIVWIWNHFENEQLNRGNKKFKIQNKLWNCNF